MNNVFDTCIGNREDIFYVKHVTYLTLEEVKENDDLNLMHFLKAIGWNKEYILPYPIVRIYKVFSKSGSDIDISNIKGIMGVFMKFIDHSFGECNIDIPPIYFTSILKDDFEKFEATGFINLNSIILNSTLDLSKIDTTIFSNSYLFAIPGSSTATTLNKIFNKEIWVKKDAE